MPIKPNVIDWSEVIGTPVTGEGAIKDPTQKTDSGKDVNRV